jgi:preprotein translocase subunit SecF
MFLVWILILWNFGGTRPPAHHRKPASLQALYSVVATMYATLFSLLFLRLAQTSSLASGIAWHVGLLGFPWLFGSFSTIVAASHCPVFWAAGLEQKQHENNKR